MVFVVIGVFVLPLVFSSMISSTTVKTIDLEPGTTSAISYSSTFDGSVNFDILNGGGELLVFDGLPALTGSVPLSLSYSGDSIAPNNFLSYYNDFTKGSTITVNWQSSGNVHYYAVTGDSNYNSWKNGNDAQFYDSLGVSGTNSFTTTKTDTYYFLFDSASTTDVTLTSLTFTGTLKIHDLSNPLKSFSSTQSIPSSSITGNTLIVHNNTPNDGSYKVTIHPAISYGLTYLVFLMITIALAYAIRNQLQERYSGDSKTQPATPSVQTSQQTTAQRSPVNEFKTRPVPKYCQTCGTAILQGSKFCVECGAAT